MAFVPVLPDLVSCDREPIHHPGAAQPHGMMLVLDEASLAIRHVAGAVEQRLGVADWPGRTAACLIGEPLGLSVAVLCGPAAAAAGSGFVGQLTTDLGEVLDVTAHRAAPYIVVELESASTEALSASRVIDRVATAAAGFERAASVAAVCDRAALEFRRLTGFDRVMVYRFLEDDAGRVMAEDRRADLHSFLHHHFPAGDIPSQARALYLRQALRVIPDVAYEPVPLRPAWAGAPLDMSECSLRSVSPVHLLYLANMGVRASASFSIVKDGVLWGLVACHHVTPRLLSYDIRAACSSLAASLSRQIKAKEEAEGLRQRIRLRSFEDDIVALLSREGALEPALANHLDEIGRMMAGDGVAVLRGRELVTSGTCPDQPAILALAAWLIARSLEPVFSTSQLAELYPPALAFRAAGSGMLGITLSAEEPWLLLWFRVEQLEIVNWAGNPHKDPGDDTPLAPRASFAAWAETVSGRARGWSLPEIDAAARLRAALLEVQQNRRVRELNRQLTRLLQDKDLLLQQKEFLIGEVNHRVQNSLMLVSNFLGLQSNTSQNVELQAALQEARRRLNAVALVHRRLYRGDQIGVVDAARYIEELCADTLSFIGQDWARQLTLAMSPVLVTTDRAVTLGLVLTELLINANKYAYGGAAGPIAIELGEDRTHLRLVVSDGGAGKRSTREGFGSRIMKGLVAQLGGEIVESDNRPGLRVEIIMPIEAA